MEDPVVDQSSVSANSRRLSSRLLRYPLRSATKTKEEKPPLTDSSNSSAPRRGPPASSVSKSVGVLDLSGKDKSAAKPPRRLSIPSKAITSPASRQVGSITPISEARAKRSASKLGKTDTPLSDVSKSSDRRNPNVLSSASYWLSQIKLSESADKHSISLGFFELAHEAGCKPLQPLKDELKSYVQRHSLVDLGEPVKRLFESYNILQHVEQVQVSETCSHVPEDMHSADDDVNSSSSVVDSEKLDPEVLNKYVNETDQVKEPTKEMSSLNEISTKTDSSVNKIAATPKSASGVSGRTTKKKLQKQEPKKEKVKEQGNKSGKEEPVNALTPEKAVQEDKGSLDAPQPDEMSNTEV